MWCAPEYYVKLLQTLGINLPLISLNSWLYFGARLQPVSHTYIKTAVPMRILNCLCTWASWQRANFFGTSGTASAHSFQESRLCVLSASATFSSKVWQLDHDIHARMTHNLLYSHAMVSFNVKLLNSYKTKQKIVFFFILQAILFAFL